jgi:hypothetical protein
LGNIGRYLISAIFAIAGVGLFSVNTANNLAEINRGAFAWDTSAVIVGLATMSALLSLGLTRIWRTSIGIGCAAALVIVGCMTTSVRLTVDRIGGIEDDGKRVSRNHNGAIDRVEANIARWREKLAVQRPIAALECRGYTAAANPKVWPKCMTARALIATYEAKLDGARAQRAGLGERISVGRHSERVIDWLFGVSAGRAMTLMQPVLIAGLLEVGTALMLGLAGLFATRTSYQGRVTNEPDSADPIS